MDPLDRIERKLDEMDQKLDSYLERTTRVEASISWLKWALSLLLSISGAAALALTKLSDK